jgi:hypothetical protein
MSCRYLALKPQRLNEAAIIFPECLPAANAANERIRGAGTRQLILAPGTYWSCAHSWTSTDNASVMAGIHDPGKNFAFLVHQYRDSNNWGTSPEAVKGAGVKRLIAFTEWARQRLSWVPRRIWLCRHAGSRSLRPRAA